MSAYAKLEDRAREINRLQEVQAIAHWDEACMMPAGGGARRGEALASLTALIHERATAPEIGELLARAHGSNEQLSVWQQANLVELQRRWVEATAVPGDLVRAIAVAQSRSEQAWRVARGRNDWAAVEALLEEVVSLSRTRADALAAATGLARYDALLDSYEPELRRADIDPIFSDLKDFLLPLLDQVVGRQQSPLPLSGPFPVEAQRRLCEAAMLQLGFDFERGRFDVSHHPFCGGVPDDTRITTRYSELGFLESFMAICHETGHALYQQGLPKPWRDQPVGDALGAAVHESQSLLMELQVCRSREFVALMAPRMREQFARRVDDPAWTVDNLYRHITRVERGLIRVDADEVSYSLHVILRYELEQQLLDGALSVADLPGAWDDAMEKYLGLDTRGDFANGCMQDVHWFAGLFGYFPTYTLGALSAAQWFATAREADPEIVPGIAHGKFAPLLDWLRANVHQQGRRLTMQPLLQSVTGERLNAEFFKQHLQRRYLADS